MPLKLFGHVVATMVCCIATFSHAQNFQSNITESVRHIAKLKATGDVCLSSAEFRQMSDIDQRKVIDYSGRIDYLVNDLHASAQSKLLYFTYSTTLLHHQRTKTFPASLAAKFGGICSDAMVNGIGTDLKISERAVRRHLKSFPK
jgi:hypothetical protein